ncbi:MAG TPA: hypothetical protein VGI03_12340 [Verrucomicrobiae bacterium]|jgi:hypothetical protein
MSRPNVRDLVEKLSASHPLQTAGGNYKRDFISAVENVYPAKDVGKILQEKFSIPNDSKFSLDRYLQSAAELSVQNDLKRNPSVQNFEIDKQVNAPKDVDAYCETGSKKIALEVKCPEERKADPNTLGLAAVGRLPDFFEKAAILHSIFDTSSSWNKLETIQNRDNSMKDFLLSGNGKFSSVPLNDNLNILFVACGHFTDMTNWWQTLTGPNELFTELSYWPTDQFRLVDLVILSNLKYLHTEARQYNDWTLNNAFILPCINPNGRDTLKLDSIEIGLSVFNHHLFRFAKYQPVDDPILMMFKPGAYCLYNLNEPEFRRYFPTLRQVNARSERNKQT